MKKVGEGVAVMILSETSEQGAPVLDRALLATVVASYREFEAENGVPTLLPDEKLLQYLHLKLTIPHQKDAMKHPRQGDPVPDAYLVRLRQELEDLKYETPKGLLDKIESGEFGPNDPDYEVLVTLLEQSEAFQELCQSLKESVASRARKIQKVSHQKLDD